MSEWRPWPMPWMIQLNPNMDTPYKHRTIWIMRDEWERPLATSARDMHPMMNTAGLRWKPWEGMTIDHAASPTKEEGR